MTPRTLVAVSSLFGLVFGCSANSEDHSWKPYFPLEDGRTWCYRADLVEKVEHVRMRSEGERSIANLPDALWIVREDWDGTDQLVGYRWAGNRLERALGLKPSSETDIEVTELSWLEVLAGEAAVGSTWTATARIFDTDYELSSKVTGRENVTVPAGEYSALRVVSGLVAQDRDVPPVEYEDWYARDIGLVQSLTRQDGQTKVEMQLEDCAADMNLTLGQRRSKGGKEQ